MTNEVSTVPAARTSDLDGGRITHPAGRPITVAAAEQLYLAARWLGDVLSHAFGADWQRTPAEPDISFLLDGHLPPSGYRLAISPSADDAPTTPNGRIEVRAADLAGAFAAAQTLRQLTGPQAFRHAPLAGAELTWPTGVIEDAPQAAWRGVHFDVARHFAPSREVRRFIGLAAAHHLNVVQLHLTDDQGWRFESLRHPELTRRGAWRTASARGHHDTDIDPLPHGGFYTQDDLREIVAYAHGCGVTVVPEIDLPGHVEAALAAYPWLGTTKQPSPVRTVWGISDDVLDPGPDQVAFFCDVLDEVCDVFDSPFVHIGGDEVPTTLWQRSPAITARAASLGFFGPDGQPDVSRLHGWFLRQLVDHLHGRGRRAVVWDEALGPDLPKDAIVMSWRGLRPGAQAIKAGHDVVLAPEQFLYLDHRASDRADEPSPVGYVRTVEDVYAFDAALLAQVPGGCEFTVVPGGLADLPLPGDRPGAVLGMQAQVWTEYMENTRRVDYAAYPRLAAFAEVAWGTAPALRQPDSPASQAFMTRLEDAHLPRLAAAGVEFRPLDGPLPWQTKPGLTTGDTRNLDDDMRAAGGLL